MTKIRKKGLTVLLSAVLFLGAFCAVGIFAPGRKYVRAEAETAPVLNLLEGVSVSSWGSAGFALTKVNDSEKGSVNRGVYAAQSDVAFIDFAPYQNSMLPKGSRSASFRAGTFGAGAYEFSLWYKAEDVTPDAVTADPRSGGISMYVAAKGVTNIDGTVYANAPAGNMELWDWRGLEGGGNVMCHVIKEAQAAWTKLSYCFEIPADMAYQALSLQLQSTFGATGTVTFTDFSLTYLQKGAKDFDGNDLTAAQKDIIGSDMTQEQVDKWYAMSHGAAEGVTKSYDTAERYNSKSNGSLKLEWKAANLGSGDGRAFLVLSKDQFSLNTAYTVTFYIKGANLAYDSTWPGGGWPLGINSFIEYYYRDNPSDNPAIVADVFTAPHMKSFPDGTAVNAKGFFSMLPGEGSMPERNDGFAWTKVQYTFNPWAMWSNMLKDDGTAHGEYFVYLGFRVFHTSGNMWIDDMSIVPQGCEIPSYTSAEPNMNLIGTMPEFANKDSELTLPKAVATDKSGKDISADIKLMVTAPNQSVILDKVAGNTEQKFTPSQTGEYSVVYAVADSEGTDASLDYKITVKPVPEIRLDNPELTGIRNRNYTVAEPAVYGADGNQITAAKVLITVKDPLGNILQNFERVEYDSFFGTSFTPTQVGEYVVLYEYEHQDGADKIWISKSLVVKIAINPLDIGVGDYRDIYVEGAHFENITSASQLVSDIGMSYYPADANKVTLDLKTDGGYSGDNYLQVAYKQSANNEATSWFYLIDLTQKPVVKDNATVYNLRFYLRCKNADAVAGTEGAKFLIRIELKKDSVSQGVPSCYFIDKYFTIDEVNAMTDWTEINLEWISYSDEFIMGDDAFLGKTPGVTESRAEVTYENYTSAAIGFFSLGDAKATLDFDDITFVKGGDTIPDYKAEFDDSGENPNPDPDPGEDEKGCKGVTDASSYVAFGAISVTLVAAAGFTAAGNRRKRKNNN